MAAARRSPRDRKVPKTYRLKSGQGRGRAAHPGHPDGHRDHRGRAGPRRLPRRARRRYPRDARRRHRSRRSARPVTARSERRYVLDTNLYIRAFRDPAANAELQRFHQVFAPFEFLSAVVAQELRAGARSTPARRLLERHVLDPFVRRDRVVTPSARAWHESGDLLADMAVDEGLDVSRVSKAFGNDVLLALSCRKRASCW